MVDPSMTTIRELRIEETQQVLLRRLEAEGCLDREIADAGEQALQGQQGWEQLSVAVEADKTALVVRLSDRQAAASRALVLGFFVYRLRRYSAQAKAKARA